MAGMTRAPRGEDSDIYTPLNDVSGNLTMFSGQVFPTSEQSQDGLIFHLCYLQGLLVIGYVYTKIMLLLRKF
jgi:hypothetical protein